MDYAAPMSTRAKVLWSCALAATLWIYGAGFAAALGSHTRVGDFFQEWASARNYFEGLPIYAPQEETAWRYLRYRPEQSPTAVFCRVNGHPPTSVLLALPLGKLPYAQAFLLWNVLSLAGVALAAGIVLKLEFGTLETFAWAALAALVLSNPLLQHLMLGQLTIPLLVLIAAAAACEARGRSGRAAALVGTAAALKMFPAYLFLYFLVRRNGRALLIGGLTFAACHAATLGLLGFAAYRDWVELSLPEVLQYRSWWGNYTLAGHWAKLFDGASKQTAPWFYAPAVAQALTALSLLLVTGLTALCLERGRKAGGGGSSAAARSGFALTSAAMLLCAPIAWDHYFLLLMPALTHFALRTEEGSATRGLLNVALFTFWLNPLVAFRLVAKHNGDTISTAATVAVMSWPFYGLCTVFLIGAAQTWFAAIGPASASLRRNDEFDFAGKSA